MILFNNKTLFSNILYLFKIQYPLFWLMNILFHKMIRQKKKKKYLLICRYFNQIVSIHNSRIIKQINPIFIYTMNVFSL